MSASLSLRGRVILGAVLWTLGLFALSGVVLTAWIEQVPGVAAVVHAPFTHVVPVSALALAAMAAGLLQVRQGLSGIDRLRRSLAAVHEGHERTLTGSYPAEVQPLVDDLNSLLEERAAAVERAVARAGDLAHGLKTPLAVLAHEAERVAVAGEVEAAATIVRSVEHMHRQMDYHLAHARAAAAGTAAPARAAVDESVAGLVRTLERLHAERGLAIEVAVAAAHTARCHRIDLDEMLGNLLDNACRWAGARVEVASRAETPGRVTITVDDDGPGLEPELWQTVLQRGVRADEAGAGTGLGLAIVRDLAELYGGSIRLDRSPLGGLRAALDLPAAA